MNNDESGLKKINKSILISIICIITVLIIIFIIATYIIINKNDNNANKQESLTQPTQSKPRVQFNEVVEVKSFDKNKSVNDVKMRNTKKKASKNNILRKNNARVTPIIARTEINNTTDNVDQFRFNFHNIVNELNNFLYGEIPIITITGGFIGITNQNPAEKIDLTKNNVVGIRNDNQNVHDSNINDKLREIYDKIRYEYKKYENGNSSSNGINNLDEEIYDYYLNSTEFNDNEKHIIVEVLDNAMKGDKSSLLNNILGFDNTNLGDKDDITSKENYILRNVWCRSKHPNNKDNEENIKYNLGKQLVDCMNGKMLHCMSGRISRYISALEMNDFEIANETIFKTKDILRKEIMDKCSLLIQSEIEKCYNNEECEWKKAAISYKDGISVDDNDMKKGIDHLTKIIDNILDEYKEKYNSKTDNAMFNTLREELLIGIQ